MSLQSAARHAWTHPYYLPFSPVRLLIRLFAPRGENIVWDLLLRQASRRGVGLNDGFVLLGMVLGFALVPLSYHTGLDLRVMLLVDLCLWVGLAWPALSFRRRMRRTQWLQGLLASPLGSRVYASAFARFLAVVTIAAALPYAIYALAMGQILTSELENAARRQGIASVLLFHAGLLVSVCYAYWWWLLRVRGAWVPVLTPLVYAWFAAVLKGQFGMWFVVSPWYGHLGLLYYYPHESVYSLIQALCPSGIRSSVGLWPLDLAATAFVVLCTVALYLICSRRYADILRKAVNP
jgi:hypothetical protein